MISCYCCYLYFSLCIITIFPSLICIIVGLTADNKIQVSNYSLPADFIEDSVADDDDLQNGQTSTEMVKIKALLMNANSVEFKQNQQKRENYKLTKMQLNMHFKCGPYHGAEGRLLVRMRKGIGIFEKYDPILNELITREDNGVLRKDAYVIINNITQPNAFEISLRTNCYVMNRVGECCAHDFIFTVPIGTKYVQSGSWIISDLDKEFTTHKRCCYGPNNRPYGKDCTFTFATNDPVKQSASIDLQELLRQPSEYKGHLLVTERICSPKDDAWTIKDEHKQLLGPICAHPEYGFVRASHEQEKQKEKEFPERCTCRDNSGKLCY